MKKEFNLLNYGVLLLLHLLFSCEKDDFDFRDQYVGTYSCYQICSYFDPIGDTLNWSSDTLSEKVDVRIKKHNDNSLKVILVDYSFFVSFSANNRFNCSNSSSQTCYVDFLDENKIHIWMKSGVLNSWDYYGGKYK